MSRLTVINIRVLSIILFLIGFQPFMSAQKNDKFVVVLDAGHGGHDPGARGVVKNEKIITLDIILKLGKMIETYYKNDVKVVYTRKTDRFVELAERANIANRNHADFFISVHCNSAKSSATGTETFVLGTEDNRSSANMSVVKQENSVILLEDNYEEKYAEYNPNDPATIIGLSLIQNTHLENSLKFASYIEDYFTNKDKRYSRGVKQAGFVVLWRAATPAVLIETGFISNPSEGKYLASQSGQNKTAESIFNAFKKYKTEWDIKRGKAVADTDYVDTSVEVEAENENRIYTVQIMSSTSMFDENSSKFKGLKEVYTIKTFDRYKYYYGKETQPSKLKNTLAKAKSAGFTDAYVVSMDKDDFEQALKESKAVLKAETNETGYRIQFLTSKNKYPAHAVQLKGLKNVGIVKENGVYKYFFGWYSSEKEAKNNINLVKNKGFKDAFVVQFNNGKKL